MKVTWVLPIKTQSEMNCSEHWTKKHKRHKQQQFFVRSLFRHESAEIKLPCRIKLTRLGPRFLDPDNLPPSMKYIQDEIAEILTGKGGFYVTRRGHIKSIKGHADNDKRLSWEYAQEKYTKQAVRIEFSFSEDDKLCCIPHEENQLPVLDSL